MASMTILHDIHPLAGFFEDISSKHVFREANNLLDAITSVGFSINDFHVWDRKIMTATRPTFLFDCTQTGCPRCFSL